MRDLIMVLTLLLLWPSTALATSASFDDLQSQLVQAAADMQGVEMRLQDLQARLTELNTEGAALEAHYKKDRQHLAGTLTALTRLAKTPREAVLLRPSGPLQAARTSMVLSSTVPGIEKQAAATRDLLTALQKNRLALQSQADQAREAKTRLERQHVKLTNLMDQRRKAIARKAILWADEARAVNRLARDAHDLKAFLRPPQTASRTPEITAQKQPEPVMPEMGAALLPVSGIIRSNFGDRNDNGDSLKGLTIESLPGAIVVSPMGGVVKYAGPFRGYGQIVLVAHKGGYYSLMSGLGQINVMTGQSIVSGEPIAILESGNNNPRATLYYELRFNGDPVNPSRKLPGLS